MRGKAVILLRIAVAIAFAGLAVQALCREFASVSLTDLPRSLASIGGWRIVGMLAATLLAYLAVATYDGFALVYAGRRLSFRRSALSSTATYAVSNLLGFAVLTGNAVRLWLFRRWGLTASDVLLVAFATTVVCNLTLALLIGAALLGSPGLANGLIALDARWARLLGGLLVMTTVFLMAVAITRPRRMLPDKLTLFRPGPLLALQVLTCSADYVATASVLYIPLAPDMGMDFISFVMLFSLAKLAGIASNIPAGLGVFEAIIAAAAVQPRPEYLAGALIAYRAVFYLVPFMLATLALAMQPLVRQPRPPDSLPP